ncbi:MAG: DUF499 domain-containing protein [Halanaerobiales bacterium]
MVISDTLKPREEVINGNFQGALQAHQVNRDSKRLENNPDLLFDSTYPSNAIKNIISRIQQKLSRKEHQGGFFLAGPYGSGKSHGLILLYHLFKSPNIGKEWLDYWHIDLEIPSESQAVILSTGEVDVNHLWEPIYKRLGKKDLLKEVEHYPTIPQIESLLDGNPLAIFLDEIETWYGSLSREKSEIIDQNEMFLQNLLEVAADKDENLFVFISLLNKNDDLKRILQRTNPIHEDLSSSGDREKIILHRLIETPRKEIDYEVVTQLVKKYIDSYDYPIEIEEQARYSERMEASYPFHPELLSLMNRIYESAAERQNVRGAMNVLADALGQYYNKTDLLLVSHLDESAFRGINMELVNRYYFDAKENENTNEINNVDQILKTILLYTLDDKSKAATESDIMLGVYQPEVNSLNDLSMSLAELVGRAHYLHRDNGNFQIREGLNHVALVEREVGRMEDEKEAKNELFRLIKNTVFSGKVSIYEEEDNIPDDSKLKFIIMLSAPESDQELQNDLENFFSGRKYQNTVVFITQKGQNLLKEREILNKTKRIAAALILQNRIEDSEGELKKLIKEERRELAETLKEIFGYWIKWSFQANDLRFRRIEVDPSVPDIKDKIGTDRSFIGDKIMEEIKSIQSGRRVGALLEDFKKFRRLPVLLDDEAFYGSIRNLYNNEGKIVLEGNRAKMYVPGYDRPPNSIEDDLTIHHPKYISQDILNPDDFNDNDDYSDIEDDDPVVSEGEDDDQQSGEPTVEKKITVEHISFHGNSPRSIVSMAEARINKNTDKGRGININFTFERNLNKEQILDFLEQLPQAKNIKVTVEVERECN